MNTAFETELEKLLGESCESIESRERSAFNEAAGDRAEKLVLFGTGGLALRTLAGLRQVGIEPVAFSDNDSRKWNTTVEGIRVLPPEDAVRLWGDKAVFIVTIWSDRAGHPVSSIKRQLVAHGTVRVISFAPLYWKYASVFLPYFALDLPHQICAVAHRVRLAAQLWEDSLSQELYLAQLRWRLWLDTDSIDLMDSHSRAGALYSPGVISADEVIVDCGAFDGDTLRAIMEGGAPFSRIVAIEPDPINCEKLRNYVASLPEKIGGKITILPFAAGSRRERLQFSSSGSMQSRFSAEGNLEVEAAPLDEVAYEFEPSYIKFDIEGAEPDALEGTRRILRDFRPKMAVSVYHSFDHLWEIPLLIKQLAESYNLRLYPAAKAGWDFMCLAAPRDKAFLP